MFNPMHFIHRQKFDKAKEAGPDIEFIHDEQMHNICEFNERNDIGWNAGMNL